MAAIVHAADGKTLARQVQIRRTQYGVPHILGENFEAASFGFAYAQAEDHLPNILLGILGARGELAQTFGGPENIEADFANQHYRVYARAVESYHKFDPDYRAMLEGFAAGLNYYVERHPDRAPKFAFTITPQDVAAYGVTGVMRFAFNRANLVEEFLKAQGVKSVARVDNVDDASVGSNMWALGPSRSRSGRALLMGNPHQAWRPASTYYEAHMTVPGKLNFYGSTFIGRPLLTSGWNDDLGWSHTVNYPDLEEIYELSVDPQRADSYLFDGGSIPLVRDDAVVKIKTAEGMASETRTFWHTPLGPVIHRTPTKVYVLKSACYDDHLAYEQWLHMTRAKSLREFREILKHNALPMFNICYADRVGNIFYLWNGTVPNLPHAAHKAEAVPAARTADVWTRFHATSELPQLFNPPGGYVQNCNSPPFLTNLHAPLEPARYPPHFLPNDLSLRSQHSLQLVDNDKKFTLEEICDLKHSSGVPLAERVKGDLIAAVRGANPSSEVQAALTALENWDNTVAADSRGAVLFTNWAQRYFGAKERYFAKNEGLFAVPWDAEQPTTTPRGLGNRQRAIDAFLAAQQEVVSLYGRPDVAWGEVHRVRKGQADLPVSGGPGVMGCFRVLDFKRAADGKEVANTGDSFVFAVEFAEPPKAYTVVAYSQSDVPESNHFSDQASLFSSGKMKRAAFTEAEIQAQLVKAYHPGEE